MAKLDTPLKKAKGLGSVKEGADHFWNQRITAIALVPLAIWFVFSLVKTVGGGYGEAFNWVNNPLNAFLLIMFISIGFYHAYLGVKVVIEDYIHCECVKIGAIIFMQLSTVFATAAAVLSIIRIYFEG